jgi:tetratricopeptide (TPR) repeat protein
MFELCAHSYETAFSYMNLGVACLYLNDFDAAEHVLSKANILDTQNSSVWGYMTLVQLKKGERVYNAFQSLKEAINLKINNNVLIYDISEAFVNAGQFKTARKALEYALMTRASKSGNQKVMKKVPEFLL